MATVFFISPAGIAARIEPGKKCDGSISSIKECIKNVGLTASKWTDFWVADGDGVVLHDRAKKVKGSIILQIAAVRVSSGASKWIDPKDADEREGEVMLML